MSQPQKNMYRKNVVPFIFHSCRERFVLNERATKTIKTANCIFESIFSLFLLFIFVLNIFLFLLMKSLTRFEPFFPRVSKVENVCCSLMFELQYSNFQRNSFLRLCVYDIVHPRNSQRVLIEFYSFRLRNLNLLSC